jgi:hypothetical protein
MVDLKDAENFRASYEKRLGRFSHYRHSDVEKVFGVAREDLATYLVEF